MDFALTAAQLERYATLLDETRDRLTDSDTPTADRWKTAAALGLTGLCVPTEYGGSGFGALDTALCLEAFGRGCPDTGLVFAISAHLLAGAVAVRDFGSERLRRDLLPSMSTGDLIAANAITEDDAGSDTSRLAVTAHRSDNTYVIEGEKSFVSNGPTADVLVTYAATAPDGGFLGNSAFAVPSDLPGVHRGRPFTKMGLEGCPAGRVRFHDCRVPEDYLLGDEGQGSVIFAHAMTWERACLFAAYIGMMDDQLDRCVAHARRRRQFGRPIARFQAVSHRIAVMKQRLESARLMVYRACWLIDQGAGEQTAAAALSKVAVSEAAVANSLDAIQIFGAEGYLIEGGIERYLRDSVPTRLFSGTTEIQRDIIAREMGL
ncbi:acyl-CoA dehydrogenase family protein [Nocardia otitidiscaviarum]|uniref:Acyl-CoA dehydrogenase family protein n=1 Tax=Nocardia otitidiscaviarum TaxID=1823 RepID=A0A516NMF1_9NOCA|nr:acyl-CoA dehydrogenase family protein [Nocardia otitidiscaviarum]MCP9624666.1 acyl-CoA dehydrogenase family protein [Nocardia otitidiscaviarum]QDP80078.1 acyl-CoA dehydrogenase family protein [Nocardia otitidiscaviarum]